jgi:hypothetical protein
LHKVAFLLSALSQVEQSPGVPRHLVHIQKSRTGAGQAQHQEQDQGKPKIKASHGG